MCECDLRIAQFDTKLAFGRFFHFLHTIFLARVLPWLGYCPALVQYNEVAPIGIPRTIIIVDSPSTSL